MSNSSCIEASPRKFSLMRCEECGERVYLCERCGAPIHPSDGEEPQSPGPEWILVCDDCAEELGDPDAPMFFH